jgi:zinc/manganese transport system substrate-binding protein
VANGYGLEVGLVNALDAAARDGATVIELGSLIDPLPSGASSHDHDDDDHADDDHADDDHGHDDDDHADDEHGHDDDDHADDEHGHDDDDHADDDHGHDDDDHADDDHADDDGHDHGDEDPHFWHDPHRMADAVPGLAELIVEALPELDADALRDRARALAEEYDAVDDEVAEILAAVPDERRYLITNHDTFGYFAVRYGFEVIGTVIPGGDTLAAPSAADLAELIEEIREHDLPAIFADNTIAPGLVRALADEAGVDVEVVTLYTDSLGEPGSDADSYVGMLLANARLVATALA